MSYSSNSISSSHNNGMEGKVEGSRPTRCMYHSTRDVYKGKAKKKKKNRIEKRLTSKLYNSSTKSMKVNIEKLMGL